MKMFTSDEQPSVQLTSAKSLGKFETTRGSEFSSPAEVEGEYVTQ